MALQNFCKNFCNFFSVAAFLSSSADLPITQEANDHGLTALIARQVIGNNKVSHKTLETFSAF